MSRSIVFQISCTASSALKMWLLWDICWQCKRFEKRYCVTLKQPMEWEHKRPSSTIDRASSAPDRLSAAIPVCQSELNILESCKNLQNTSRILQVYAGYRRTAPAAVGRTLMFINCLVVQKKTDLDLHQLTRRANVRLSWVPCAIGK